VTVSILYETHSITTDNENGIATGWLPGALSAAGRVAARELGERRRNDGIDVIYVSDLVRALETVRLAFERTGIPIHVDGRLRECNYGTLNGMPRTVLERERASHIDVPWPGGESYNDVVSRTRELVADLRRDWQGCRVLVIGHSANRWALEHLLEGRDLRELIVGDFEWQRGWEFTVD